jgi:hypothetical protein
MDTAENKGNAEKESNKEVEEIRSALDAHRIEKKRNDRHEIIVTILLSFATLISAWCSYQADFWDDKERVLIVESIGLDEDANKILLESNQLRTAHLNIVSSFIDHYLKNDTLYCLYILAHSDTILKPALMEWVKRRPKNVPEIPNPLQLSAYGNDPQAQFQEIKSASFLKKSESEIANNVADRYLLLTVMLGLVLFFSGISGTLNVKVAQILSLIISFIILLGSIIVIINLPIGHL